MAVRSNARRSMIISLVLVIVISIASLSATLLAGWKPKLGLDLAGGLSVVYKPAHKVSQADLQTAADIITNRIDGFGVSGAQVNIQGNTIVVSAPGVTNARQVLQSISQTGQLLFRPVECLATIPATTTKTTYVATLPSCNSATATTAQFAMYYYNHQNLSPPVDPTFTNLKSTPPLLDLASQRVLLPLAGSPTQRYVLGPAPLTGTAIASASAGQSQIGQWEVNYSLTSAGSAEWDALAQSSFHTYVAIELDGVVQSAPIIQPDQATFTSFGGSGTISGNFTETQAKALANIMQYGALPVKLIQLTTQTVSPSLGHSALVAGLGAGLVGLALVLLYTIVYYRGLGLVIVLGLTLTAALLWAIISALAHTAIAPSFDLAGVTGLIVSIGITVDSYIVYFERLKDETRAGRTLRTSVDRGFKSAWRTVLAADFVSLLAAGLLYLIAVGSVRGFAFFLGLSTLMDIFFTWYFTRPIVTLLGRRAGANPSSAMSLAAGVGTQYATDGGDSND